MPVLAQGLMPLTPVRIIALAGVFIGAIVVYIILNITIFGSSKSTDFITRQQFRVENSGKGLIFGFIEIGVAAFFLFKQLNDILDWDMGVLAVFGFAAMTLFVIFCIAVPLAVALTKKGGNAKMADRALLISSPFFGVLAAGIAYFYNLI